MALNTINIGNIANDGTGDDLRTAFHKANENFEMLDQDLGTLLVTGANLGVSGEAVYAGKTNNTLEFKKIQAGNNISLSSNNNSITIDSAGGITDIQVITENGSVTVDGSDAFRIQGGNVLTTRTANNGTVFIDLDDSGILANDTNPTLSSSLQANSKDISNARDVYADKFIGSLEGVVHDIDIRDINAYFEKSWNFGEFLPTYSNLIDYVLGNTDIDMGTFEEPAEFDIETGTF